MTTDVHITIPQGMHVLGITGGIGSGKSYVAHMLQQAGIPVYDCDSQAKRLNEESPQIRAALIRLVGDEVYQPDGHLCRPVLARYLFASPQHAAQVDAIIHPHVKADFVRWCHTQAGHTLVGVESAILYESGFDALTHAVLFVDAPLELRIQRAMQRDGSTRDQVLARIRRQDTDLARQRATYIIMNDNNNNLNIKDYVRDYLSHLR